MPWSDENRHHGPPWGRHGGGDWPRRWGGRKPRFLFIRFLGIFGLMILFVLGGMAALAFLITRLFGGDGQTAIIVWIGGLGLAFAFPILAVAMAVRAFRSIAMPLSDVMTTADAVAEGDLTARVPERRGGEFGRLARSFNRMTEELQKIDQQRRNLTADVAHELRTPLHVIQGNLEGVLDGVYEPTEEHITTTLDETRLLARLINDLRTLSLAESGQLQLVKEPLNVRELLEDIATSFSGQAEAAGIELCLEVQDTDSRINADAGRMYQILGNLVVNALRHTPSGGQITLSAEQSPSAILIVVGDTGEGISSQDLPHIFDRFWRGDKSRTHVGGAGGGLGLAIVRQLVRAHNGEIHVKSTLGQGTTFMIELPANG